MWADGDVNVTDATFLANGSNTGPALYVEDAAVTLDGVDATENIASTGHVVDVAGATGFALHRSRFCHNLATSAGHIVAVTGASGGPYDIANNVWLENGGEGTGAALMAAPADWLLNAGPAVNIANNDFVGNAVTTAVSARGVIDFRNNIVAGHAVGFTLEEHLFGNALGGGYNLWVQNAIDAQGTAGAFPTDTALLEVDPKFQGYTPGDCASNLWLAADSPARDAGDPDLTDPDGSPSDIGAFGGPGADLEDGDGDGWLNDLDCDDADPDRHPGLPDIPYDGVDNDCDGADLCDGDGDGFLAEQCGGADCDDTDPDVHPGVPDPPDDGLDNDCDGFEPRTFVAGGSTGCGCATGGAGSGWLAVIALAALRRR